MSMRMRVLLPLCHATIDVALLVATVHAVDAYRSTLRHPWPLWHQQYERVDRDFLRNADGPPMAAPLQALTVGTLPASIAAGLIAEALFSNGSLSWKVSSPFDFRLAGLHLCLAGVWWYAVGRAIESRWQKWKPYVWWYTAARLLTIPGSLVLRVYSSWLICVLLFVLTWIAVAVVTIWVCARHLWINHRAAAAPAR
jgi:hypothetical protein